MPHSWLVGVNTQRPVLVQQPDVQVRESHVGTPEHEVALTPMRKPNVEAAKARRVEAFMGETKRSAPAGRAETDIVPSRNRPTWASPLREGVRPRGSVGYAAPSRMLVLRPLSLGEIVDRSATFWRSHWRALFQLFLGFQLAQYVLFKAVEVTLAARFPAALDPTKALELMQQDPAVWGPSLVPVAALFVAVSLVNLLVGQMSGVALTGFVFPRLVGEGAPTVGAALRLALGKLGPGLGLFALTLGWTALVGVAFLLPGGATLAGGLLLTSRGNTAAGAVVALVGLGLTAGGLLVLVLWFLLRFVLTSQVLAIEPGGALAAFLRTGALSSGRVGPGFGGLVKGRLTLLLSLIFAILLVLGFLTSLPELVVKGVYGALGPGSTQSAPELLVVPAQLLQVVVGAVLAPLYVVFQVVFYVDMRVRREGLDLELSGRGAPA